MCDGSVATIKVLLDAGYNPQSVVDAVLAADLTLLRHEGRNPVQLQPPDDEDPPPVSAG